MEVEGIFLEDDLLPLTEFSSEIRNDELREEAREELLDEAREEVRDREVYFLLCIKKI